MFYAYWSFMSISLISSFAYVYHAKKNKNNVLLITSCIQSLLSIFLPFTNLIYITNQEWLDSFQNEFAFLWSQMIEGNVSALFIVFAYLTMIVLVIWNGRWITDRIRKHTIMF